MRQPIKQQVIRQPIKPIKQQVIKHIILIELVSVQLIFQLLHIRLLGRFFLMGCIQLIFHIKLLGHNQSHIRLPNSQ
jgi:hypothetical protein